MCPRRWQVPRSFSPTQVLRGLSPYATDPNGGLAAANVAPSPQVVRDHHAAGQKTPPDYQPRFHGCVQANVHHGDWRCWIHRVAHRDSARKAVSGIQGRYLLELLTVTQLSTVHANRRVVTARRAIPLQVVCFDKIDYCSSLKNLGEVADAPNFKFVKGNLLSADLIK